MSSLAIHGNLETSHIIGRWDSIHIPPSRLIILVQHYIKIVLIIYFLFMPDYFKKNLFDRISSFLAILQFKLKIRVKSAIFTAVLSKSSYVSTIPTNKKPQHNIVTYY